MEEIGKTILKLIPLVGDQLSEYAVLVFRDQNFTNEEQLDFARRFDGTLHARTSSSAIGSNRFGNEALADVSNVDKDGKIRDANNRMRASSVANRLWHTDASFVDPPGRYSMLSARVVPPVRADTEFADMRAAYDALDAETRATIEGLSVYHSIVYSRHVLGFDFSPFFNLIHNGALGFNVKVFGALVETINFSVSSSVST